MAALPAGCKLFMGHEPGGKSQPVTLGELVWETGDTGHCPPRPLGHLCFVLLAARLGTGRQTKELEPWGETEASGGEGKACTWGQGSTSPLPHLQGEQSRAQSSVEVGTEP